MRKSVSPRLEPPPRIFLLSPANCSGRRAQLMLMPDAQFTLARALRSRRGAALGDVFSFVSGLYFRGKLTYARRFARPPDHTDSVTAGGVLVITANAGLRAPDTRLTIEAFRAFAGATIGRLFPAREAGLLMGLALGDDSHLDEELARDFHATGLGHLLVVSGDKVAYLGGSE